MKVTKENPLNVCANEQVHSDEGRTLNSEYQNTTPLPTAEERLSWQNEIAPYLFHTSLLQGPGIPSLKRDFICC